MTRRVKLAVNDLPIDLDYFVAGYLDHVVGGIVASLRDTGEVRELKLNIDNEGQVTINLNGADVPLTPFPVEIIGNTMRGIVAPLKGVDSAVNTLELTINR
ncbi:MAG TPA: hypothetical protein VJ377_01155 [Dehalococcoidales bacterium]|nr:hypothetical protein [Dehalococcoidales bacterium]